MQLEYDHNDFDRSAQQKQDEMLAVRFFLRPKKDEAASLQAGRDIWKDVEYIDIRTPGSKDAVCRPARQRDIQRFPRHYQAFKTRIEGSGEVEMEGTPLVEWPLVTRSRCEELAFFNVRTVEDLANMSDGNAMQMQGIQSLKRKAEEWLSLAAEQKSATELQEALGKRDDEIADLQKELAELKAAIREEKPKRKRRTKAEIEADKAKENDGDATSDSE